MKRLIVLVLLVFISGGLLLYYYSQNRHNAGWDIKKEKLRIVASAPTRVGGRLGSNIREVLFLNDMFRDYESVSGQNEYVSTRYVIDLATISKIKGNIKTNFITATVKKSDVLFVILERKEAEILIFTDRIAKIKNCEENIITVTDGLYK